MTERAREISSIHDLARTEWPSFVSPFLSGEPAWFGVFEGIMGFEGRHILVDDAEGLRKLLPVFINRGGPVYFTHDLPRLLCGSLLGQSSPPELPVEEVFPYSVSVSPNAYRFSLASKSSSQCNLSGTDVDLYESLMSREGMRLWAFLFHGPGAFFGRVAFERYS